MMHAGQLTRDQISYDSHRCACAVRETKKFASISTSHILHVAKLKLTFDLIRLMYGKSPNKHTIHMMPQDETADLPTDC